MWNPKQEMIQMNLLTNKKETQTQKRNLWLPGGWDSQGVWEGHVHTAIFKMDTNKHLLYSTWNSAQCYVPVEMGGGFEGKDTRTCMAESLRCSPETTTTLLTGYTPIQNKKFKVKKNVNDEATKI